MKQRLLKGKTLEWIVLGLFVASYCVITAFHEPWFDEAQSWQIAKCATLKDILFTLPHYEGHPPLWHLLLMIPARAGVPFEIGMKSVGLIICTISAGVLLFRSRLPRAMRLLLPFTYFFFYQYGIIVRPYCLMLLALLLLGIHLPERNEHPWKVFFLLALLCLTSAYGLLMAGGIAVCILWDLWREKGTLALFRDVIRDPRERTLLVLLLVAMLIIIEIIPAEDCFAVKYKGDNPLWICIVCALFSFPLNCFFLSSSWFGIEQFYLQAMEFDSLELIFCCLLGAVFWLLTICASSRKNVKYLVVPFVLYAVFAAVVYFATHHMGMVFLLFLFWAELLSRDEDRFEIGRAFLHKLTKTPKERLLLRRGYIAVVCCAIAIPLYWNGAAAVHDVEYDYCYARDCAAFLQDTGLENSRIMFGWVFQGEDFSVPPGHEDYVNTYLVSDAVTVNAYFSRNLIFNLNDGEDSLAYVLHKVPDYEESRAMMETWRKKGAPDVIIGVPMLGYVYGDELSYSDYSIVAVLESGYIWKNMRSVWVTPTPIFLRDDLLETYGLEPSNDYYEVGLIITK